MTTLAKRTALILLLFAFCFALGLVAQARTQLEFAVWGMALLILVVAIFAPAKWWLKKG